MRHRYFFIAATTLLISVGLVAVLLARRVPQAAVEAAPSFAPIKHAEVAEQPRMNVAPLVVATATTKPLNKHSDPLPPAGTPLKQTQAELGTRAARGDAAAASRLFRDSYECVRFHYMLQDATREHPEQLPAEKETLNGLDEVAQQLHRSESLCAGIEAEINDGRIYRIALRAAELGDLEAACAYVNAPALFGQDGRFGKGSGDLDEAGDPISDQRDEELISEYRQRAIELGNAGIMRGDWNMVEALRLAFGSWAGPVPFANPLARNPMFEYRYEVLWMLGENEQDALQIRPPEELTTQQVAEAQAWAQTTYRNYFAPRPGDSTAHICGIPPLTGLQ